MVDQSERVALARARVAASSPLWAGLASRLSWQARPGVGTAGTDGVVCVFEPKFVADLTDRELVGLVAHEVGHCLLDHHGRMGQRIPDRWNVATDQALNGLLKECGFTLPGCALYSPVPGECAEVLYALALKAPKPEAGDQGEDGDGESDSDGDPGEALSNDGSEGQDGSGEASEGDSGSDTPGNGSGDGTAEGEAGGSGEGEAGDGSSDGAERGNASQGENSGCTPGSPQSWGQVYPAGSLSGQDPREVVESWQLAAEQAVSAAQAAGCLPGSLAGMLRRDRVGSVDWRDVLREYLSARGRSDYTWSRVRQAAVHGGAVLLPRLAVGSPERVGVLVDTSGSCSYIGDRFIGEVAGILSEFPACVGEVWAFDATSYHLGDLAEVGELVQLPGGGGTVLGPAVAEALGADCKLLVVLTDLYLADTERAMATLAESGVPVLWVVPSCDGAYALRVATYGRVVVLE
jgi:predicted metal-dependent peptidase